MLPSLLERARVGVLLVLLVWCAVTSVSAEAQPKPDIVTVLDYNTKNIQTRGPRSSWLHWWEVNRDRFQEPLVIAGEGHDVWADVEPELRERLLSTLNDASESPTVGLRSQSALALGRLSLPESIERLEKLRDHDEAYLVQSAAWLGLGLHDTFDAQRSLYVTWPEEHYRQVGLAHALGVRRTLDEEPLERLFNQLKRDVDQGACDEATRGLVWALSQHQPEGYRKYLWQKVQHGFKPRQIDQAMVALGQLGHLDDLAILSDIVSSELGPGGLLGHTNEIGLFTIAARFGNPQGQATPEGQHVHRQARRVQGHAEQATEYLDARVCLPYHSRDRDVLTVDKFRLRLFGRTERKLIRGELARDWNNEHGHIQKVWLRENAIALGAIGHHDDVDVLLHYFNAKELDVRTRGQKEPVPRWMKLGWRGRTYAAVGMGLWLRANVDLENPNREMRQAAKEVEKMLLRGLANKRENTEFRAACALALGLSTNPDYGGPLLETLRGVKKGQDLLAGYIIEAMGMLGDDRMLSFAQAYLVGKRAKPWSAKQIVERDFKRDELGIVRQLGMRAAVRGLGLLPQAGAEQERAEEAGEDKAEDRVSHLLRLAWGEDPHVSGEIAWVMRRRGMTDLLETAVAVLELTKQRSQEQEGQKNLRNKDKLSALGASTAAMSLGIWLGSDSDDRLRRMTEGWGYRTVAWYPNAIGDGNYHLWKELERTEGKNDYLLLDFVQHANPLLIREMKVVLHTGPAW